MQGGEHSQAPAARFFDTRVHLITGKGGVGKSTVSAALAVEAAARGRRPLLVEMAHRPAAQSLFGVKAVGWEPARLAPGVWGTNIAFEDALSGFFARTLRSKRLARAAVENPALNRFFRASPAVAELATLSRLLELEAETHEGAPRWDPILVDLEASGHALMLLGLPKVFGTFRVAGPVARVVDAFTSLLTDPSRMRLSLVTLPSPLPTQETIEIYGRLMGEGHAPPMGWVFVNQALSPPLGEAPAAALEHLRARGRAAGDAGLLAELELAARELERFQEQGQQLTRLRRELPLPLAVAPRLDAAVLDPAALAQLGAAALEGL